MIHERRLFFRVMKIKLIREKKTIHVIDVDDICHFHDEKKIDFRRDIFSDSIPWNIEFKNELDLYFSILFRIQLS